MNKLWNLDLGATTHCTSDGQAFKSMSDYRGTLGTASMSRPIVGEGTVQISLSKGSCDAKLGGVKYVPGMQGNLLSMQVLCLNGIYNEHGLKGFLFFRLIGGRWVIITHSVDVGLTSYLSWV